MDISTLTHLGFHEKAAHVYLATLSLGTASILEIAKKANLKRPTVYIYIEELLKSGLLEKIPIGKKDYFHASDPHILENRAQQHLFAIQKALPELEALQNNLKGKPSVRILEGERGLKQIYDEICLSSNIRFWSNLSNFEIFFQEHFKKLSESISEKGIRTREIIANTPESKKSAKRYASIAGKNYSARIAVKAGILNDNAIYSDVIALFRIHEYNLYVIRIEDAIIANAMKTLFDMAWNSAEVFIN